KRERLNRVLGTTDWEQAWYHTPHGEKDLFGDAQTAVRTATLDAIERTVEDRLVSVFQGGGHAAMPLHNKQGGPPGAPFVAVSNPSPKASRLALDIARHILRQPARRLRRR